MTSYTFEVYRDKGNSASDINEYFIDKHTGGRVYTYIHGQKQMVNYPQHGITRSEFEAFVNRRNHHVVFDNVDTHEKASSGTTQKQTGGDQPVLINNRTPASDQSNREGFLSSGVYGATYDEKNRSLIGQSLYTDMMLENGTTWRTLGDRVKKTGRANDGPNILGAGPGNEFDGAMKAHLKNVDLFDGLSTEYQTPEKLKEINKNINQDMGSTPTNALYNRGFQSKAKIVDIGDRAVCAMPEKFMPERDRNRQIFKTHQVISYPGYDVNIERIGQDLNAGLQAGHTQRSHGRRLNIPSKSKDSLLASQFGGIVPKQFGATAGLA